MRFCQGFTELKVNSELLTIVTEVLRGTSEKNCMQRTTVNTLHELPAVSAADLKLNLMEPHTFCREYSSQSALLSFSY